MVALALDWALSVPDAVSLNSTPLMIDGVLYFSADRAIVHAVDARSGKLIWSYDPQSWKHAPRGIAVSFNTNRGIAHYEGSIFVGTADGRLVSLDAGTGMVNWATRTFGRDERKSITGAPRAFDGKVFIGNGGAEFGTRGFVSAYGAADGELLWRAGDYFSDGSSEVRAGEGTVTFHHRTMAELLGSAAAAGWVLERIVETPHHELDDQGGIPRLLACGWWLP